jgi:hypothetical protein
MTAEEILVALVNELGGDGNAPDFWAGAQEMAYAAIPALEAAGYTVARLEEVARIEDLQASVTSVLNADDYPDETPLFRLAPEEPTP